MSIGKWIFGFLKSKPKAESVAIEDELLEDESVPSTDPSSHDIESIDDVVDEIVNTFDLPSSEESVSSEATLSSDAEVPTDNPFRVEASKQPEPIEASDTFTILHADDEPKEEAASLADAGLPPRRDPRQPEISGEDPAIENLANTSPTMSAIPPRGSAKPLRPNPATPPEVEPAAPQEPIAPPPPPRVAEPEPEEIEVLDATAAAFAGSAFAHSKDDELAELRLALEASHNELSQLTSQRDQAMSRSVQYEKEMAQLRQQVQQLEALSESLQHDRQNVGQLESEVERLRAELSSASVANEQIQQLKDGHDATVEELRLAIGQREAAEASLARERDNLSAQNEELSRKIANLEERKPDVSNDEAAQQLAALQSQHQTAAGELSLANETIRQLNQNITHRDSQLMSLRQEAETLKAKLQESTASTEAAETQKTLENQLEALQVEKQKAVGDLEDELRRLQDEQQKSLAEIETRHAAAAAEAQSAVNDLKAERKELISKYDELAARLSEAEQKDTTGPTEEEHEKVIADIEAQHKSAQDELRALLAERESERDQLASEKETLTSKLSEAASQPDQSGPSMELSLANETIRQLNQNLTARDAELFSLRKELKAATETSADAEVYAGEIEKLKNSVADIESDRNRLRDEFNLAKENLHNELTVAKEAEQAAREELQTRKNQIDDQARVIEELREDRNTLQQQVTELRSLAGDNSKIAELESKIEKISGERDETLARYDRLQIDLAHAVQPEVNSEKLEALEEKLKQKSADYDALRAEHHTMTVRFEAEVESLKSRLESEAAIVAASDANKSEESDGEPASDRSADAAAQLTRIAELEAAVDQHEQYAAGLQREKQDLMDRLGASQEDVNAKAAEMRKMRERLTEAEKQATEAIEQKTEYDRSQSAQQELSQAMEGRESDLRRIQDEQFELKQQLAHYEAAEEQWNADRLSLFAQLGLDEKGQPIDGAEAPEKLVSSKEAATLRSQVADLESQLAEKETSILQLNKKFEELSEMYHSGDDASVLHDDASDPIDAMRSERDQAAASAAEASATIAKLMSEVSDLKSEAVESKAQNEQLESALEAAAANPQEPQDGADNAATIAKLEEENKEYRRSVAELHAAINELEESNLELIRSQETSRDRLSEAARANAELSAQVSELSNTAPVDEATEQVDSELVEANKQLSDELNAIKRKTNDLQRERDAQTKTIAELREEIDSAPQDKKEGTKAVRDAKRLTKKVEAQEKQIEQRDDRLQELAGELARLRTETGELTNELAQQKAIVRAMKGNSGDKGLTDQNGLTPKPRPKVKATTSKKAAKKRVSTKKKTAKKSSKTSTKQAPTHAHLGTIYSKRPPQVDDLKQISGIGPVLEKRLNQIGIYQFEQVKCWSKVAIDYLDEELALGGRIRRDKWVSQAKKLTK